MTVPPATNSAPARTNGLTLREWLWIAGLSVAAVAAARGFVAIEAWFRSGPHLTISGKPPVPDRFPKELSVTGTIVIKNDGNRNATNIECTIANCAPHGVNLVDRDHDQKMVQPRRAPPDGPGGAVVNIALLKPDESATIYVFLRPGNTYKESDISAVADDGVVGERIGAQRNAIGWKCLVVVLPAYLAACGIVWLRRSAGGRGLRSENLVGGSPLSHASPKSTAVPPSSAAAPARAGGFTLRELLWFAGFTVTAVAAATGFVKIEAWLRSGPHLTISGKPPVPEDYPPEASVLGTIEIKNDGKLNATNIECTLANCAPYQIKLVEGLWDKTMVEPRRAPPTGPGGAVVNIAVLKPGDSAKIHLWFKPGNTYKESDVSVVADGLVGERIGTQRSEIGWNCLVVVLPAYLAACAILWLRRSAGR